MAQTQWFAQVAPQEGDLAGERVILSLALSSPDAYALTRDALTPQTLADSRHEIILACADEVAAQRCAPDWLSVGNRLRATNRMESAGGEAYFAALRQPLGPPFALPAYLAAARTLRRRMDGQAAAAEFYQRLADPKNSVEDAIADLSARLAELGRGTERETAVTLGQAIGEHNEKLRQRAGNPISGVPTGIAKLDAIYRGWDFGSLNVVGAGAGEGKSAFALNLAVNMARAGWRALIFTFEMASDEFGGRAVSLIGGVDNEEVRRNQGGPIFYQRLDEIRHTAERLPIMVEDGPYSDFGKFSNRLRMLTRRFGVQVVFVDHLHLMEIAGRRGATTADQVNAVTRGMKLLAMELRIVVVLLAQLNRQRDNRAAEAKAKTLADIRPYLSDLKSSGGIEQDANNVLLLCRPKRYNLLTDGQTTFWDTDGNEKVYVFAEKNRNGETGKAILSFRPSLYRFAD